MSKSTASIHFLAPTAIVTAFLAAVVLAVGHHLFYRSLNGTPVLSAARATGVINASPQKINITVGNIFSTLVGVCLSISVSTSYMQLVWASIKVRSEKLSRIDSVFSGVRSITSLFHIAAWRAYPGLAFVALTFWLTAIPLVIPPATLSVHFTTLPAQATAFEVPNVDFKSLNFADVPFSPASKSFIYSQPSNAVLKVAQATSAIGAILPLSPPMPNSTWSLDYHGPRLGCKAVSDGFKDAIIRNVESAVKLGHCLTSYGYISWGPTGFNESQSLPFRLPDNDNSDTFPTLETKLLSEFDFTFVSRAILYVAVFPHIVNKIHTSGCTDLFGSNGELTDSTILQCELYNSTYHSNFSFINGEQLVDVNIKETLNKVDPVIAVGTAAEVFADDDGHYGAVNFTKVEALAYQAVFDAFGQGLVGSISSSFDQSGTLTANTSILASTLSETKELAFLGNWKDAPTPGAFSDLVTWAAYGDARFPGTSVVATAGPYNRSLSEAMEDMFLNLTIGLMSSSLLQPNYTSPFAPPLALVTNTAVANVYTYSATLLWIGYGTSLLLGLIAGCVGILVLLSNGVSYSDKFSTIWRCAQQGSLDTTILPEDMLGDEPLPKHLGDSKLRFFEVTIRMPSDKVLLGFNESRSTAVLIVNTADQSISCIYSMLSRKVKRPGHKTKLMFDYQDGIHIKATGWKGENGMPNKNL
ncbi:hypothetical protein O1611_g5831 [Lasiodiplodia mahajangana]|uniref:Uncharacterized protein n=1 Tax=Lasiodiplodia mahajangana TaxID=1108764 RepID=A0ACC2JJZ1_9PEZI|nr:hypothetical protein O1611_g5831 [Lasiodiplodia mahajangana]